MVQIFEAAHPLFVLLISQHVQNFILKVLNHSLRELDLVVLQLDLLEKLLFLGLFRLQLLLHLFLLRRLLEQLPVHHPDVLLHIQEVVRERLPFIQQCLNLIVVDLPVVLQVLVLLAVILDFLFLLVNNFFLALQLIYHLVMLLLVGLVLFLQVDQLALRFFDQTLQLDLSQIEPFYFF